MREEWRGPRVSEKKVGEEAVEWERKREKWALSRVVRFPLSRISREWETLLHFCFFLHCKTAHSIHHHHHRLRFEVNDQVITSHKAMQARNLKKKKIVICRERRDPAKSIRASINQRRSFNLIGLGFDLNSLLSQASSIPLVNLRKVALGNLIMRNFCEKEEGNGMKKCKAHCEEKKRNATIWTSCFTFYTLFRAACTRARITFTFRHCVLSFSACSASSKLLQHCRRHRIHLVLYAQH